MSIRIVIASIALTLLALTLITTVGHAQSVDSETTPPDQSDPSAETVPAQEDMVLVAVPKLVRLHVPMLTERQGVLVRSVVPESPPFRLGLRAGDILLEAGGKLIRPGDRVENLDSDEPVVVVRRGRTRVLHPRLESNWYSTGIGKRLGKGFPFGRTRLETIMRGKTAGRASASTAATEEDSSGRAVSASRAGNENAVEMAGSDVPEGRIRFSGTAERIEQQLESDRIPEAVRDSVRRVLEQMR